jgi:H/ACA ribonucleoprotein complex subunit 2
MGRVKKEVKDEDVDESMEVSTTASTIRLPAVEKEEYARLCALVNPIASPMAGRKLAKKLYKLLKSLKDTKDAMRTGLADVMKGLRKNETGIVVLAGRCFTFIRIFKTDPLCCVYTLLILYFRRCLAY